MNQQINSIQVVSSIDPPPESRNSTPVIPEFLRKSLLLISLCSAVTIGGQHVGYSATPSETAVIETTDYVAVVLLFKQLDTLPHVWTSSDSLSVSAQTLSIAKAIILSLPSRAELPHVSSSADAEVGLSWVNGEDRFETILTPDNHIVWATKMGGSYQVGDDVNALSTSGISEFHKALGNFYGRS